MKRKKTLRGSSWGEPHPVIDSLDAWAWALYVGSIDVGFRVVFTKTFGIFQDSCDVIRKE
jgi:hypothetical protein